MIELRRNSGEGLLSNSSSRGEDTCCGTRFAIAWTPWEMQKRVSCATGPRGASRIGSVHFDLVVVPYSASHPASRVPESRPGDRSAPAVGAEGAAIEPAVRRAQPHQPVDCPRPRARCPVSGGLPDRGGRRSLRMAWVGTVNPQTGVVEPAAFAGFEDGYLERIHIVAADVPEGQGPTGQALRGRRHFVCADIAADPRLLPWRDEALARGYRSSAAFPLQFGDSVVGYLPSTPRSPGSSMMRWWPC